MEKVNWKVEGMTCSNCALSVNKVLQKQGMQHFQLTQLAAKWFLKTSDTTTTLAKARKNIEALVILCRKKEK